jgi:uncharacterized protein (TIGR03437 family)
MRSSVTVPSLILALLLTGVLLAAQAAPVASGAATNKAKAGAASKTKTSVGKRSALSQDPCARLTAINFGVDVNGTLASGDCALDDGSFADLYSFSGTAGQQIAVSLSSTAFDTYLFLLDADQNVVEDDDDGGGGTNSRIPANSGFLTLPATGTYIIVANSFNAGETGAYTLRLNSSGAVALANVSAASFSTNLFAPNSIIAAFGTGLATQTASATARPLPTTLGGTRVDIISGGTTTPASLFFVSPTQVNYLLPANIPAGAATVRITNSNNQTVEGPITVANTGPGLFTANSNGMGVVSAVAVRVAANGAQTTEAIAQFDSATGRFVATPINLGPESEQVILVLFGTGIRQRSSLSTVTVTIGGTSVPVEFAGAQGQFDGLDQVNVRLPRSLIGRGEVDLVLTVEGRPSNTVRVRIQ